MKKALTELWYTQAALAAHDSDDAAGEKRLSEYLDKHFSDLSKKLDDRDKEILQKYKDCYDELLLTECENAFAQGFSLATRLVTEALNA